MASPENWLFYVDSSTSRGNQICLKLAIYPEKRQNCGLSSLGSSLRYFMTGYPVDKSWAAKTPQFAIQESKVVKSLESSGYRQVWSIHGGLIDVGSGKSVEHTLGRKRKRQPTINQVEEVNKEADQASTDQGIQSLPVCKHGLLIGLPHEQVIDYRIEIGRILEDHGFHTGLEFKKMGDDQWQCDHNQQSFQLVKGITSSVNIPLHPAFRDTESNFLFHSQDQVLEILKKCPPEGCMKELIRLMPQLEDDTEQDLFLHHPFVVIEGMDATGKTTLVNRLAPTLGATKLHSPPECLSPISRQFNHQPTLFRRVYYTFGNYMVGKAVVENCSTGPVIMDRYWHSSAVYTIAAQCSGDSRSLPPPDSYVYKWPNDLPRPTLVILLSVSEEERDRRMRERIQATGEGLTKEEGTLQADRLVRERIMEAYRRMRDPGVVEISADGTKEEVMESVLLQLKAHNILK